jgi:hypothetical protein
MTKEEALDHSITIWWWNHEQKKKDFEGTYKQWFLRNSITVTKTSKALVFSGSYGSMTFAIHLSKDYVNSFNEIIQFCLVHMGDKASLRDGFGHEYKINWR